MRGVSRALGSLLAIGLAGAVHAQVLEVHADGGVISYDGATQHMSRGAVPTARLLTPAVYYHARHGRSRGGARPVPAPPEETAAAIHAAAERHQVDERLVTAVAWRESGFNPRAVSPKGARGTMQLMPETARRLGVDASDLQGNIDGGVQYLSSMMHRFGGDQAKALAAYNAGPGAVERYGGVPPYAETKAYVDAILGRMGAGSDDGLSEVTVALKTRMAAF